MNLTKFKTRMMRGYEHAPHLDVLDRELEQVSAYAGSGGAVGHGRLIVSMPPRHGKSTTASRLFPLWHLGRYPDHRIILTSYAASLSEKHSRAARNMAASTLYYELTGQRLADDSQSIASWALAGHDGGLDALGVGGGVTGKGGHIILVDDPVASRQDAESLNARNNTWDWFTDDLYTRREPGGAVVIVMTRWHADDLVGRALREMPGQWREVKLPALAEPGDFLGRPEGAALWPARFPTTELARTRTTLGDYAFAGLYQQRPVLLEGGMFKGSWFTIIDDIVSPLVATVRYWDLAMSSKSSADYSVGVQLGVCQDASIVVMDVARFRLEWGDVVPAMAATMLRDTTSVPQGVEQKGFMSRAIQELNSDPRLHGHSIFGYDVDGDKVTRALPFAARCAAGQVRVLRRGWTDAFLEELMAFPAGEHDDQVDAASGAWAMMGGWDSMDAGSMTYAKQRTID